MQKHNKSNFRFKYRLNIFKSTIKIIVHFYLCMSISVFIFVHCSQPKFKAMIFKADGISDLKKKIKALELVFGEIKILISGYVIAKNVATGEERWITFHNDQMNDGISRSITIDRCDGYWATWETKAIQKLSFTVKQK